MQGPGEPFDPSQPPVGDEEAMRRWWEQLDQPAESQDPRYLDRGPAEGQGAEPPPPPPARGSGSPGARRGLFAQLSRDDLARAFVLGEVLGPPRSRRGRR